MKKRKMPLAEWLSIKVAKNPSQVVLAIILLFNVIFFLVAALIIDNLALPGTETLGFWESLYYSVMMVLDAGNDGYRCGYGDRIQESSGGRMHCALSSSAW